MISRRPAWLAILLVGACAPGAPIAGEDARIVLESDSESVALGRAFSVRVVRSWRRDLQPDAWSDQQLAPLYVRLLERKERDNDTHHEELLRFECYAFELEAVTLGPLLLEARSGRLEAAPLIARSEALTLEILPALGEQDDAAPELPRGLFAAPLPWRRWLTVGGLAGLGLGLFVWLRKRLAAARAARPASSELAPPEAHRSALAGIAALRDTELHDAAAMDACYVELSKLVRVYIEQRFALHAPEMTTEEFLSGSRTQQVLDADQRRLLGDFLTHCDLVKFAAWLPDAKRHAALFDAAEGFVRDTCATDDPRSASAPTRRGAADEEAA